MNNYLLMVFNNQTLEEISTINESEDFVALIYSEFTGLYQLDKYTSYIMDILKTTEIVLLFMKI